MYRNTVRIQRSVRCIARRAARGKAQATGSGLDHVGTPTARGTGEVFSRVRVRGRVGGLTCGRWKQVEGVSVRSGQDPGTRDRETQQFSWHPKDVPAALVAAICVRHDYRCRGAHGGPVVATAKNCCWNEPLVGNCTSGGVLIWRVDGRHKLRLHCGRSSRKDDDDLYRGAADNARYDTVSVSYCGDLSQTGNCRFARLGTDPLALVFDNDHFDSSFISEQEQTARVPIETKRVRNDGVPYGSPRATPIGRTAEVPAGDAAGIHRKSTLSGPLGMIDETVVSGVTLARHHVLTHAGAGPADRSRLDRRVRSEVRATTSPVRGRLPGSTPLATWHRGGAVPPNGLSHRRANGLRAIEDWLRATHVAAGGRNGDAAAEWAARPGWRPR